VSAATPAAQSVEREDVVRGFELPGGELVTVTEDELVSIAPERSRTIEIEEFVDIADIDPVFYEKSYHLGPVRGMGAEKPYALLLRAMQGAGMVGIGRFVLRTKPHVVAIRPLKDALALETLFFADEVRSPAELTSGLSNLSVSDREQREDYERSNEKAHADHWQPNTEAPLDDRDDGPDEGEHAAERPKHVKEKHRVRRPPPDRDTESDSRRRAFPDERSRPHGTKAVISDRQAVHGEAVGPDVSGGARAQVREAKARDGR